MTNLNKNDYFIDVSAYQEPNAGIYGIPKTIIKVTEGTSWYSTRRQQQAETSQPVGYYHFARFGGSVGQAQAEASYFIRMLPNKKVKYLVCDYEDSASGDRNANTQAVLAFMRACRNAGYQPIFYGYVFYSANNLDLHGIVREFPKSLWMAGYAYGYKPKGDYNTVDENTMKSNMAGCGIADLWPHVRWVQFTSTGVTPTYSGSLDKNIVLIGDEGADDLLAQSQGEDIMFTVSAEGRGIALIVGGSMFSLLDANDPKVFWQHKERPVPHYQVSAKTFDEMSSKAVNNVAQDIKKGMK